MLEAAFHLLADTLRHIISQIIHQPRRDGRICAKHVAVMNLLIAPRGLRAMSQPTQIKKTLIIRMSERQLTIHVSTSGHRDASVIEQPSRSEAHGTPDGSTLRTQHPAPLLFQDIADKPVFHSHTLTDE